MSLRPLLHQAPGLSIVVALLAAAPHARAIEPPRYGVGVNVTPDAYVPGDNLTQGNLSFFNQNHDWSSQAQDLQFIHRSALGTVSTAAASAGPEHGGTLRLLAQTNDEVIDTQAALSYAFRLVPRVGAVLPEALPLRVEARGTTEAANFASSRISFTLGYLMRPDVVREAIQLNTGTTSTLSGSETWGGNGRIDLDEVIEVVPGTDVTVSLFAAAGAGYPVVDGNWDQLQHGRATAFLDPVFTLPSEWAGLVDIVGVPGGAITSPVPEPATAALLIAGLAVVAGVRRRG